MLEDYKYILPVVGVIIGWFLNELSAYFRNRRNNLKEIRTSIFHLIELIFRLEQMTPIFRSYLNSKFASKDNTQMVNSMIADERESDENII